MHLLHPRFVALAVLSIPLLLACSATYKVDKVTQGQATVANPGVYYMLPKTDVLTVLTVGQTTVKPARYTDDEWANCVNVCLNRTSGVCKVTETKPVVSHDITGVRVFTRSIADTDQLYRVNVDFGTFAAFNHSFKLNDQGVLTLANAELENKTAEVVISTAKALTKLVVGAAAPSKSGPSGADVCTEFRTDYAIQQRLDREVEAEHSRFDRALTTHANISAATVDAMTKRHEERLTILRGKPEFRQLVANRKQVKEAKSVGDYASLLQPDPHACTVGSPGQWLPIQSFALQGYVGLSPSPADASTAKAVLELLKTNLVTVTVTPASRVSASTVTDADNVGFRYRIPTAADVVISQTEPKTKVLEQIGSARIQVAQYGALVSLPAKVKGIKSKIVLDMYETTGSPKQIDVGATPQPTSIVGDALSPVQEELDRRNKEEEEAKVAAEAKEIADLTKERDTLKLKKEIKDLEAELDSQ